MFVININILNQRFVSLREYEESRCEPSSRSWNITIMLKVVATCIIAIPTQQHSLGRHIRHCNNVWRHAFEHRNEPLKFTVQIPTSRAALLQMSNIIPDGACYQSRVMYCSPGTTAKINIRFMHSNRSNLFYSFNNSKGKIAYST